MEFLSTELVVKSAFLVLISTHACALTLFQTRHSLDTSTRAHEDNILRLKHPVRGRDGKLLHEILVPKGTIVWLGNYMCGTTEELWGEDALEWKPERWRSPLPSAVVDAKFPGIYSNLYVTS